MTIQYELQKIRERSEKATDGPWQVSTCGGDYSNFVIQTAHITRDVWRISECHYDGEVDAEFIAHARTDIPRLIKCVERLVEGLEYYENPQSYSSAMGPSVAKESLIDALKTLSEKEK